MTFGRSPYANPSQSSRFETTHKAPQDAGPRRGSRRRRLWPYGTAAGAFSPAPGRPGLCRRQHGPKLHQRHRKGGSTTSTASASVLPGRPPSRRLPRPLRSRRSIPSRHSKPSRHPRTTPRQRQCAQSSGQSVAPVSVLPVSALSVGLPIPDRARRDAPCGRAGFCGCVGGAFAGGFGSSGRRDRAGRRGSPHNACISAGCQLSANRYPAAWH